MARVAKIDNAEKKRFERVEKKRQVNTRTKLIYFLIVCEGEKTEPNYFKALEKDLPQGTVEIKIDGTGRNTIGLVNYTIMQRENACKKYDRVWVVFDKDTDQRYATHNPCTLVYELIEELMNPQEVLKSLEFNGNE